jgi:hydroxyethylthiazole kinase
MKTAFDVPALTAMVRERRPLVHHITNNVVTNFTANVTLALGASPVMAPCIQESPEMAAHAGALLLNIGTLDPEQVASMLAAGAEANRLGIPVILDPVGAGATSLRTRAAAEILGKVRIAVIRGNAGEVLSLAGAQGGVRGVDSLGTGEGRESFFLEYAGKTGAVIAVTGEHDFVTDGKRWCRCENGHPIMGRVTGTGCGATTSVACFLAAGAPGFEGTAAGLAFYALAGQVAGEKAQGPGSFVPLFLDALAASTSLPWDELRLETGP